ncbi:MAG: ribosome biogenesis GTPase Der [Flavobacteriaceae bacterium]|nr:ribosome biogenesis GTPase Der [Flavobacteriaceae bacterium]
MGPIVAIVGRPNVGKSAFFNRMIKNRQAIVHSEIGVTRDRHYGKSFWNGVEFTLIDTGGYLEGSDDIFQKEIDKQVLLAINEADLILFMVDIIDGLTGSDQSICKLIRKSHKPVLLIANKADNSSQMENIIEFYSLGFEKIFPLSSINGNGTGELLDELINQIPKREYDEKNNLPKFAIVGGPNVGKSSFVNKILGEDRYIVTEKAGTTRDSLNTYYNSFGFDFILVDTAGIRKKSKVKENIEFYSVMRSIKSIERSDICILMIDAMKGFNSQDQNIFWLAHRNGKGIIILVNKWDLIEKKKIFNKILEEKIKEKISPFTDVPISFISVKNKQRLIKSLEIAVRVHKNRLNRISSRKLNDVILPIIEKNPPPSFKGKFIKIKFCKQLKAKSPKFSFFCNFPKYVKEPYRRFLENKLRENFDFFGVPIQIIFKEK